MKFLIKCSNVFWLQVDVTLLVLRLVFINIRMIFTCNLPFSEGVRVGVGKRRKTLYGKEKRNLGSDV